MDSDNVYRRFHELVDLPSERQSQVLEDIRAFDPELAAELVALLDAHHSATDFLEEPLRIDLVDSGESLYVGRKLGAYRIDRLIARGGMGMVFLAHRDDGAYDRRVAIKLVDIGEADSQAMAQFHREREILATLEHPNIASVVDGGITSDGQPYLVMPFVDGLPITRYTDREKLSQQHRIRLFLTVCDAVAHAHRNLVVHRDLKPGNILVDDQGHVILLDFGIAKVIAEETDERTQTGSRKYTPLYAAPEQLSGGKVTTATDVYALGVVLHEMLTGVLPTAPERSGTLTSKAVDPDLRTIIDTCIEENPQRRYSSVETLAADLQRYLDHRPIMARPATWRYRTRKFIRRNKTGAITAVAVVLMAVIYVTTVLYQNRAIAVERDRALLEQQKTAQIADFLQSILSAADPAASGRSVTVIEVLGQAMHRIDGELAGQPDVQASLWSVLASTYSNLGDEESANSSISRAIQIRERLYGPNHPETAALYRMAGNIADRAGFYDEALAYHGKAFDAFHQNPGRDSIEFAKVSYFLGATHLSLGNWAEAEALSRDAVRIYSRTSNTDSVQWASALNNLAMVLGMLERFSEAVPAHEKALALMREYYGDVHVDVASTLYNLGGVYEAQGKKEEALPYYLQALEMRRQLLGDDHPMMIINLSTLASLYQALGKSRDGVAYVEEAVATSHRTLPQQHPLAAYALSVFGALMTDIPERIMECEEPLRVAYDIRQALLPEGHWTIASTQGTLGLCLLRNGKRQEAEPLLKGSYENMKAQFGPDHARTVQAEQRLSELL